MADGRPDLDGVGAKEFTEHTYWPSHALPPQDVPFLHTAPMDTAVPTASIASATGTTQRRPGPYQESPPSHSARGGTQAREEGLHSSPSRQRLTDTPWQASRPGRHTRPVAHSVAATGCRGPWSAGRPAREASQLPQLGAAVMPRLAAAPR